MLLKSVQYIYGVSKEGQEQILAREKKEIIPIPWSYMNKSTKEKGNNPNSLISNERGQEKVLARKKKEIIQNPCYDIKLDSANL